MDNTLLQHSTPITDTAVQTACNTTIYRHATRKLLAMRPVSVNWRQDKTKKPEFASALQLHAYIRRLHLHSPDGKHSYDFTDRADVAHMAMLLPTPAPPWTSNIIKFWNAADAAAAKIKWEGSASAWHIVADLPRHQPIADWIASVERFAKNFTKRNLAVDFAIHDPSLIYQNYPPHVHLLICPRRLATTGMGTYVTGLFTTENLETFTQSWASITGVSSVIMPSRGEF